MESTLTSKGQATIPKAVREHLHLSPGDRVKFFLHPDGSVVLLPKVPISSLRGTLKNRFDRVISVEEMDEGIAEAVADRDRQSRQG